MASTTEAGYGYPHRLLRNREEKRVQGRGGILRLFLL